MSNPDERGEPEDLLLSALYREGADELPPDEIDQAIRAQARKMVRRSRWWSVPRLALVMSLLLAVGLGLRVFEISPPVPVEQTLDHAPAPQVRSREEVRLESFATEGAAADQAPAAPAMRRAPPVESARIRMESKMRERAKRGSAQHSGSVCLADEPPEKAGATEWLRKIRDLRQAGQLERASCLQKRYTERFSRKKN